MLGALNPYSGAHWSHFIVTFFQRLGLLIGGKTTLASDELQILILSLIAASAAMVGVFLIYRKMTMQANALSHSILFGIALTYLMMRSSMPHFDLSKSFQSLFITTILTGFITAFLIHLIVKVSKLQKDAAVGLVFTTLFALGIILISLFSRNSHVGIELVIGNVDALHTGDIPNIAAMFTINISLILLCFGGLKLTTFDPIYSRLQGLSLSFYHYLVIFLLSMTSIGSFRAVGVVLVLSFFIIPPLIAKNYAKSLFSQMIAAMGIGVFAAFLGVVVSRHILSVYQMPLSTGGVTVLTLYALFFTNYFLNQLFKKLRVFNLLKNKENFIQIKD